MGFVHYGGAFQVTYNYGTNIHVHVYMYVSHMYNVHAKYTMAHHIKFMSWNLLCTSFLRLLLHCRIVPMVTPSLVPMVTPNEHRLATCVCSRCIME